MTQITFLRASTPIFTARTALGGAARLWFVTAVIGQWAFLYYIAAFYGPSTLTGHFEAWRRNTMLTMSYVPRDTLGNLAFAGHVLLAAVIAFGGALQIVPQIRARAPALHRWNGRLFMVVALGLAVSGLYITWVRERAQFLGGLGVSLNAGLIILCVALAWRTAVARDLAAHRRWALRAWIAGNGQWFTRVGFMAVAVLHRAWAGPFFMVWGYASTLVPLAVLEIYLWAQTNAGPRARLAVASGLLGLTVLTMIGIVGVYMGMWRPLIAEA
jgi:uncharacterized membrane protein